MQPVHQTGKYLGPLPLELFVSIITLSLDSINPHNALDRLEQLRLVNKTWLATIDSTPRFWTSISNVSKSLARIKEWIKKSGDAPLRITSTIRMEPTEPFMALCYPLAHRWKSVTVSSFRLNASAFFDKPAPLLEELHLGVMSFEPDMSLFAGVTPSLLVVDLFHVTVPRDLGFLKHLKSLQLRGVTYPSGKLAIVQLYDILSASPNLRRLNLATDFEGEPCRRDPLPFPVLADLAVSTPQDRNDLTSAILSMIAAPNLTKIVVQFNNGPPATVLPLSISWLKRQTLDQPRQYDITIGAGSIVISIVPKGDGSWLSEDPQLHLSWQGHFSINVLIEVLEELERSVPSHAAVTMEIYSTHRIVDYLKTPRINQDGTQTWPLSNLRSIRFKRGGLPHSFDSVSDFARVRRDIARITILSPGAFGLASILHVWDASSMSFVPQSRPVIGNGVGSDNEVS
ncbi:hypothetical protein FRC04_002266 [Tulasnella sp. 424]|nr:hypothetical protein FRC04_002266 [Tulasnella sp. 424]